MRIYLLRRGTLVERDEAVEQVLARSIVVVAAVEVGEVVTERRTRKLLGEEIDFIQEENLGAASAKIDGKGAGQQ
jgi:hypothetical protein